MDKILHETQKQKLMDEAIKTKGKVSQKEHELINKDTFISQQQNELNDREQRITYYSQQDLATRDKVKSAINHGYNMQKQIMDTYTGKKMSKEDFMNLFKT